MNAVYGSNILRIRIRPQAFDGAMAPFWPAYELKWLGSKASEVDQVRSGP